MREPDRDAGRLKHIVEYAENIERMLSNTNFEQFEKDYVLYFAVMKNVV